MDQEADLGGLGHRNVANIQPPLVFVLVEWAAAAIVRDEMNIFPQ
jgi:hypothetical protein